MDPHLKLLESQLSVFISENLVEDDLPEGVDPLTVDAIDSLGLEQLVEYIRSEFGVVIADEEMVRKNFASVPALASFVESKQRARG